MHLSITYEAYRKDSHQSLIHLRLQCSKLASHLDHLPLEQIRLRKRCRVVLRLAPLTHPPRMLDHHPGRLSADSQAGLLADAL